MLGETPGLGIQGLQEFGDLLGRRAGLAGQLLDLAGDDREAPARVARARGLDGGVEGKHIGLLGDRLDLLGDLSDLVDLAGEQFQLVVDSLDGLDDLAQI